MNRILYWALAFLLVAVPAWADVDSILGVDSANGIPQALTPAQAADLIGASTTGNTFTGNDETNPFEIFGTDTHATHGWSIDETSTGDQRIRCKTASGLNKCDQYKQIDDTYEGGFKDKDGTKRLTIFGSGAAVQNFTIDGEGTGNNITLYQRLCGGDLVGVDPATGTAGHIWNKSPLGSAPTATAVTGTNRTMGVATFPDSDGDYGIQLTCALPPGWAGNIDAVIWWKTAGTGNARFQVQTKCYADDAADDASFNAASVVTAAAGTSGRPNRQALTAITSTGCAADSLIRFRFFRNRTEASDSLNAALDVEKVEFWVRNTY